MARNSSIVECCATSWERFGLLAIECCYEDFLRLLFIFLRPHEIFILVALVCYLSSPELRGLYRKIRMPVTLTSANQFASFIG